MEPAAGYEMGDGKRTEAGVGESGAHSFDESVTKISRNPRGFNRKEEERREKQIQVWHVCDIRSLSNLKLHILPIIREILSIL